MQESLTTLRELAFWAQDVEATPELERLSIKVDWQEHRRRAQKDADDGWLVDVSEEAQDEACKRYHWAAGSPVEDEDETWRALQEDGIAAYLDKYTQVVIRVRDLLAECGIGHCVEGPSEGRSWGHLYQRSM